MNILNSSSSSIGVVLLRGPSQSSQNEPVIEAPVDSICRPRPSRAQSCLPRDRASHEGPPQLLSLFHRWRRRVESLPVNQEHAWSPVADLLCIVSTFIFRCNYCQYAISSTLSTVLDTDYP